LVADSKYGKFCAQGGAGIIVIVVCGQILVRSNASTFVQPPGFFLLFWLSPRFSRLQAFPAIFPWKSLHLPTSHNQRILQSIIQNCRALVFLSKSRYYRVKQISRPIPGPVDGNARGLSSFSLPSATYGRVGVPHASISGRVTEKYPLLQLSALVAPNCRLEKIRGSLPKTNGTTFKR